LADVTIKTDSVTKKLGKLRDDTNLLEKFYGRQPDRRDIDTALHLAQVELKKRLTIVEQKFETIRAAGQRMKEYRQDKS
jgi:hypothetical protein